MNPNFKTIQLIFYIMQGVVEELVEKKISRLFS